MKATAPLYAFLIVFGSALPLMGQPASDLATASLEELMNITVTTATRTNEGVKTAPARVQVITSAQVRRRGYRSLADLLKDMPEFKVDFGGDQDYQSELTVEGTRGTSRLIVLLDGIRVSSPTNEPLPILANYPVHHARQIEIVFGPASALYGADAFSGVINIISRTAEDSTGVATSTSVGQFGLVNQTASYGRKLGTDGSLMFAGQFLYDRQPDLSKYYPEEFAGMIGQRTGVFQTIFGPMTAVGSVSPDYGAPLSGRSLQASFRKGRWQAVVFESHERASVSLPNTPDNAVYNPAAATGNRLFVSSGSYRRDLGPAESTTTLTYSRHEMDRDSGYWNAYSNMTKSFKYAFGSMVKLEEQLTWRPRPAAVITAGATHELFHATPQTADLNAPMVSSKQPGTLLGTDILDELNRLRYTNTAGFAQLQYSFNPRLTITAGARGDYNSRFGTTFNPRAGLVMQLTRSTTAKLLYGTAFLAPSPFQAYAHWGSFYTLDGGQTYASDYWHVPNPDLAPQRKRSGEASVEQAVGANLRIAGSAFVSKLTNLITESDADHAYSGFYRGWPVAYIDFAVNQGESTVYGGSGSVSVVKNIDRQRRVEARAAVSIADGSITRQGQRLPIGSFSPVQARFTADVDWFNWSVAPRLALVSRQRVQALVDGGRERRTLPGYAALDVNVRRRLTARVDFFILTENAFDNRYRAINARAYLKPEEMVGAPQNPRRFTAGVDLQLK